MTLLAFLAHNPWAAVLIVAAAVWFVASVILAVADWRRSPEERAARLRQMRAMTTMTRERQMEWWMRRRPITFGAAMELRSRVAGATDRDALVAFVPELIAMAKDNGLAAQWVWWAERWRELGLGPAPVDLVRSEVEHAFDAPVE